jgi:serine/threonine protein kinase
MNCANCRHVNPPSAKFCQGCGAPAQVVCAGCGEPLPSSAKFCHECGRRADERAEPSAPAAPKPVPEAKSFASDRYQLRRLLGEGSRKRVHLAWDNRLEREVAFSLIMTDGLDEGSQLRVRREAPAMARLGDHPNIATVHDIGEEGGEIFIVSEYMSGGDLEQHLQRDGDRIHVFCGTRII